MGKVLNIKDAPKDNRAAGRTNYMLVNRDIGASKFSVTYNDYNPNMTQKHFHYHKQREQVIIVLEGSGTYQFNDKTFELKPNDVIFIQPNDKHGVKSAGSKGLKVIEITSAPWENDLFNIE